MRDIKYGVIGKYARGKLFYGCGKCYYRRKGECMAQATFEEALHTVMAHVRARKWDKTATPRGLAIPLSLEANELLEYFQWSDKSFGSKDDLASELADIFIYAIQFAEMHDIDIPAAIQGKIETQEKKYPVEIFEIDDENEKNRQWLEAKKKFRKDTTF